MGNNKKVALIEPKTPQREMTTGKGGCPRCGGYVIRHIDWTDEDDKGAPGLRCLICGKRHWFTFVMVDEGKRRHATYRWRTSYAVERKNKC